MLSFGGLGAHRKENHLLSPLSNAGLPKSPVVEHPRLSSLSLPLAPSPSPMLPHLYLLMG